jgi:prenyltransferase beta subunit
MTIRQDMLKAASRAKHLLRDSADLIVNFVDGQINQDGGFKGRSSQSDLYYTVFGIEALLALDADIPQEHILNYLLKFGDGSGLDLVHLACLARCRANVSQLQNTQIEASIREGIIENIETYRSTDGDYNALTGASRGSAYASFLALGAYQDLNIDMGNSAAVADCIKSLRTPDGAYSNDPAISRLVGTSTPATAAALTVLHYLNEPVDNLSTDWLLSRLHPKGGFTAMATPGQNGMPDLLSTATALHVLALIGVSTDNIKERCLDFLDTLWSTEGGFRGSWTDDILDCEYTYYGLLALGHLSS